MAASLAPFRLGLTVLPTKDTHRLHPFSLHPQRAKRTVGGREMVGEQEVFKQGMGESLCSL